MELVTRGAWRLDAGGLSTVHPMGLVKRRKINELRPSAMAVLGLKSIYQIQLICHFY